MNHITRNDGRNNDQLRPLKVQYNVFGYATCSVLFEVGNTKVQSSVTLQEGVPPFLRNQGTGWLTAEYCMLPTATASRTQRDANGQKVNGRSIEISRLISRALRSIIDLKKLGEKTIIVDCDVLQADGGTRTACITSASVALEYAIEQWTVCKQVPAGLMLDKIAAVSAGVWNGVSILDPDFAEDSQIYADFNFVLTHSGNIVEIQGTAEKSVISWQQFNELQVLAMNGVLQLVAFFDANKGAANASLPAASPVTMSPRSSAQKKKQAPLFSLMNR